MLSVTYTNKDKRSNFCQPYKYLIQKNGAAYSAFVNTSAFKRWLRERGLKLVKCGKQYAKIEGDFIRQYASPADFERINGATETMVLSNGAYVPCKIKDGIEHVYHKGIYDKDDYKGDKMQERIEEYRRLRKIYG